MYLCHPRAGNKHLGAQVGLGLQGLSTVEARKLEHHYAHALKVKYRESQHESS